MPKMFQKNVIQPIKQYVLMFGCFLTNSCADEPIEPNINKKVIANTMSSNEDCQNLYGKVRYNNEHLEKEILIAFLVVIYILGGALLLTILLMFVGFFLLLKKSLDLQRDKEACTLFDKNSDEDSKSSEYFTFIILLSNII